MGAWEFFLWGAVTFLAFMTGYWIGHDHGAAESKRIWKRYAVDVRDIWRQAYYDLLAERAEQDRTSST